MTISRLISYLITLIKNEDYSVKYEFSFYESSVILWEKLVQACRGLLFVKPFLKSARGLVFCEKGVKIRFGNKISSGRNLTLGRGSQIYALSKNGVTFGDNFKLGDFATIECTGVLRDVGEGLVIGDNVAINQYCFIGVRGLVEIGDNVIFGPRVSVFSENHNFSDKTIPIKHQGVTRKKTVIEGNVWIGSGSNIMAGVTIGTGSVIAAGSVVTKDVPPFTVNGGVPAKELKKI